MEAFEHSLDEIFVTEGIWKDRILPATLGGAIGLGLGGGAGHLANQRLNPPNAPYAQEVKTPQQVDVHKDYPKVDKKEPAPVELNKEEFPIDEQSINIVASTLILEAGGEPEKNAMLAIMNVIHQRARGNPNNYVSVALKPMQFSCHNDKTPQQSIDKSKGHAKWRQAVDIVEKALRGEMPDVTGGADHYHVYKGPSECKPSWTHPDLGGKKYINGQPRAVEVTVYIGDHVFLKNVNKTLAKKY
jgi:hypothetical protein